MQVDGKSDKYLGGELIDNSQRVQMTVHLSLPRIQIVNTLEKVTKLQQNATTSNWLVALVNRKRSLVLVSFLVDDIMRKSTNKATKPKRTKSTTKITFDSEMGRSIAEVATSNKKEGIDKLELRKFEITCIDLRVMNHETKEDWVETSTKQILLQSQKDRIEKKKLKAQNNAMAKYI